MMFICCFSSHVHVSNSNGTFLYDSPCAGPRISLRGKRLRSQHHKKPFEANPSHQNPGGILHLQSPSLGPWLCRSSDPGGLGIYMALVAGYFSEDLRLASHLSMRKRWQRRPKVTPMGQAKGMISAPGMATYPSLKLWANLTLVLARPRRRGGDRKHAGCTPT
ncbi:hypothetical protein PYCCODRAFT_437861 [Trametes coccinea BRFM310]|uniref:Uncharacterized protein n=1 Tax=Trametes coccinea (strain BRFM310) TaxID=1353009 RepID=A0A1Y2ILS5_TRAC3|nr:hypothetical protein PYCCODRAFT_437861 [Trametes coccinea BRFM310]